MLFIVIHNSIYNMLFNYIPVSFTLSDILSPVSLLLPPLLSLLSLPSRSRSAFSPDLSGESRERSGKKAKRDREREREQREIGRGREQKEIGRGKQKE